MTKMAESLSSLKVESDSIAIGWLGQAGFVFKTPNGQLVYIDPYLSDYCQKVEGNEIVAKRLIPTPMEIDEIKEGLIIVTHAHEDHADPELIVHAFRNCPKVELAGPISCIDQMRKLGVSNERMRLLKDGQTYNFDDFSLAVVYADHGQLEPDAIGVVVETDGVRIYHTGDTCYCPEKMAKVIDVKPDIIIPCINGTYGNLSAVEAAKLANDVGARIAIPSHYWFFICQNTRADCTPAAFLEACEKFAPETVPEIMAIGELYVYRKE